MPQNLAASTKSQIGTVGRFALANHMVVIALINMIKCVFDHAHIEDSSTKVCITLPTRGAVRLAIALSTLRTRPLSRKACAQIALIVSHPL